MRREIVFMAELTLDILSSSSLKDLSHRLFIFFAQPFPASDVLVPCILMLLYISTISTEKQTAARPCHTIRTHHATVRIHSRL